MYLKKRLHASIVAMIQALQTTDSEIITLLRQLVNQTARQNEILTIGNAPRLLQADADQLAIIHQQEIATFLSRSGFFANADAQTRLCAYLPPDAKIRIAAERYAGQSTASFLTTVVQAAAEYSALPTLAATAYDIFDGSVTGRDWVVRCARWGIRLPPHEGDHDGE